jgi:Protein of unknown function (DUF664)
VSGPELLVDGFGRIREIVHDVLDGLTDDGLQFRVESRANTIAWLVWHLTRVQDDHIAGASGLEQVWFSGWQEQFALPLDRDDTGYGHDAEEAAAVRVPGDLLVGYHDATYSQTVSYIRDLTDADMDRVVDRRWDPPVTMGVRMVSVLADDLQHAGQAAYVRGILERR